MAALYRSLVSAWCSTATCASTSCDALQKLTREQVIEQTMKPFHGTAKGRGFSTIKGKVLCGYQGWHAAEGDGWAGAGITGGKNGFRPGSTNVDLWPDVSELAPEERYATPFRTAEGKTLRSIARSTPERCPAFPVDARLRDRRRVRPALRRGGVPSAGIAAIHHSVDHCREGANKYGRTYAVMYDLSGMRAGRWAS